MPRTPITWKNVDGPDFSKAAYIQQLAGQRLDTGFEKAEGVVKQLQDHEAAVLKRNSADFNNRVLQQYQTPEALREAQATGNLEALRNRYAENGGLDLEKTGAANTNKLVKSAQQRVEADQLYNDGRDDFSNRGAFERLSAARAQGQSGKEINAAALGEIEAGTLSTRGYNKIDENIAALRGDDLGRKITQAHRQRLDYKGRGLIDSDEAAFLSTEAYDAKSTANRTLQSTNVNRNFKQMSVDGDYEGMEKLKKNQFIDPLIGDELTRGTKLRVVTDEIIANTLGPQTLSDVGKEEALALQTDFEQTNGFKVADVVNDPEALANLKPEQTDALNAFFDQQEAVMSKEPALKAAYNKAVQQYIDKGYTELEARAHANKAVTTANASAAVPDVIANNQSAARKALTQEYPQNGIIQEYAAQTGPRTVADLLGDDDEAMKLLGSNKNKEAFIEMMGAWKNNKIPVGFFGNKKEWPVTKDMMKFAIGNAKSRGGLTDFFTTGNSSVKEEIGRLIENKFFSNNELQEFEDWTKRDVRLRQQQKESNNAGLGLSSRPNAAVQADVERLRAERQENAEFASGGQQTSNGIEINITQALGETNKTSTPGPQSKRRAEEVNKIEQNIANLKQEIAAPATNSIDYNAPVEQIMQQTAAAEQQKQAQAQQLRQQQEYSKVLTQMNKVEEQVKRMREMMASPTVIQGDKDTALFTLPLLEEQLKKLKFQERSFSKITIKLTCTKLRHTDG